MGEQHVVGDSVHVGRGVAEPWRLDLRAVAQGNECNRLVERGPRVHLLAKLVEQQLCVLDKVVDDLSVQLALGRELTVQLRRKVKVVERHDRLDVVVLELVDERVLERDARWVCLHLLRLRIPGHHARPGDQEPKRVQARVSHQLDVAHVPVVEVVGAVGALDHKELVAEVVPDGRRATAFIPATFDLLCGRGGVEEEAIGKAALSINGCTCGERMSAIGGCCSSTHNQQQTRPLHTGTNMMRKGGVRVGDTVVECTGWEPANLGMRIGSLESKGVALMDAYVGGWSIRSTRSPNFNCVVGL